MATDYGYGELENKLIELLKLNEPDFAAADELIRQGADINAMCEYGDNVLSDILNGYVSSAEKIVNNDICENCWEEECQRCENFVLTHNPGPHMLDVIRYFIKNGFDINGCEGRLGAQCLSAVANSTYDRYMIDAIKIFFDEGIKIDVSLYDDDFESAYDYFGVKADFQFVCEHNYPLANTYEAAYQLFKAYDEGKPYKGIDSYEIAAGRKILRVLSDSDGENPVFFTMNEPEFAKDNCFNGNLYFVYDGGVLIVTEHVDCWTDTVLPDVRFRDVTDCFGAIIGSCVTEFLFDHRDIIKGTIWYNQPIITIKTDVGKSVRISKNFGQVAKEDTAAFYELV